MTLCKQKDYLRPILSLCALRGWCGKPELGIPAFALLLKRAVRGEYLPVERALSRTPILSLPNATTIKCSPSCCGDLPHTIIFLVLHMCDFTAVMSRNINIDPPHDMQPPKVLHLGAAALVPEHQVAPAVRAQEKKEWGLAAL